jgi:large repetitive protein
MKTKNNNILALAVGLAALALNLSVIPEAKAASWVTTGPLTVARSGHTATLLPNGKVLVAGGYNGSYLSTTELYDPATGTWTATGAMNTAHEFHTATLLPNGKVLVAGGYNGGYKDLPLSSAELYDPASGTWTTIGSMHNSRGHHTATLLPSGKVLVAAGQGGIADVPYAELYDPASGTWTATGALVTGHSSHTATLLANGKVLVAGGYNNSTAELYDPASGTWAATGSLITARSSHTATLLPSGKVLVTGGESSMAVIFPARSYTIRPAGRGRRPAQ